MGGLPAGEGGRADAPRRGRDGARCRPRRPLRPRVLRPAPGKRPAVGRPAGRRPRARRPGPAQATDGSIVQEARRLRHARQAGGGARAIGPGEAKGPGRLPRHDGPEAMTTIRASLASAVDPALRNGLAELLRSLADDEFVIGFADSEWTGIAPILEEDVAMSSIAQDELGHARAFYGLLGDLVGEDPDHLAYDRPPESFRHCRLVDHARAESSYAPLAELVAKIRREERYHLLHVDAWLRRLATAEGEPRDRLVRSLETLGPDATSVFTPLPDEEALVKSGILPTPMAALRDRWMDGLAPVFAELDLPMPPRDADQIGRASCRERV